MAEQDIFEDIQVPALALHLMAKSVSDTAHVTNQLADGYRREIIEANARVHAIQQGYAELCSHPWAPNPAEVDIAVLHPDPELVRQFRESYARSRGWDPETGALTGHLDD